MRRGIVASAVAALVACGSTAGSGDPGGGSGVAGCTLTISGAATGSYPCTDLTAVWSDTTDTSSLILVHGVPGQTSPAITVTVTFPERPQGGTYVDADGGTTTRMTVVSGASTWKQSVGGPAPTVGSYTLVLTRIVATKTTDYGQAYSVNGTLDASLLPAQGTAATGEVALHASF